MTERERPPKNEDADFICKFLVISKNSKDFYYELDPQCFIDALYDIGYLEKSELAQQYSELLDQVHGLKKKIESARQTVDSDKSEISKKIYELEKEMDSIYDDVFAEEEKIFVDLLTKVKNNYLEILLPTPITEEKIKDAFDTFGVCDDEIELVTDAKEIEKYTWKDRQETQENALKIYNYFMSDSQCKLAIGNFVKLNSKAIENIVMGSKHDEISIDIITMLTNVLIENKAYDFNVAKIATHKAIISTLLNEWTANFKEQNDSFCQEINMANKDESIKLFTSNFDKAKTSQKTMYSFFMLLYDIKVDFNTDISSLHKAYKKFESEINAAYDTIQEKVVYENFKGALFTYIDANEGGESFTIDDIDLMDGTEFEHYIAKLFTKMGYITEVTKHSGDQGIDVIAKKGNTSIGIQAKCYSGTVGNSAVQEAASGKALYKVDKVMVITNNEFTPAAKQLAEANNVILWDRNILKDKVVQYGT